MGHEHCSALEFGYHFVSNTAVLLCSYSEQPERAAACFVPSAVCSCVCVHRAYPVYCRPLYMSQKYEPRSATAKILWSHFFLVCRFFCLFTFFAVPLDVPTTSKCIQLNSTYESCVAVAVPMNTYEGCCCTQDLQDSPSWLPLLLIVDQLVYRAVSLLCLSLIHI